MKNAIELVRKIKNSPEENWLQHIEEINLHIEFSPVFKLGYSQRQANLIVCFIIMSYDRDSQWIDLSKDRMIDRIHVLEGLGIEQDSIEYRTIFKPIIEFKNDEVQEIILKYLLNQVDSRWQEIHSLFDYSTKMILFCNRTTKDNRITDTKLIEGNMEDIFEDYDLTELTKFNKEKGDLLEKAINARRKGEELLEQIKKDYVKVDHATQGDFGFEFTDSKKYDATKWRHFIIKRNQRTA